MGELYWLVGAAAAGGVIGFACGRLVRRWERKQFTAARRKADARMRQYGVRTYETKEDIDARRNALWDYHFGGDDD